MKQLANKTQIFFLFLALAIFNAHLILPHDHHLSADDLCNSNLLINTNHHPAFPTHCHAFNDLVLNKAVVINHFQSFQLIDVANYEVPVTMRPGCLVSYYEDTEQPLNIPPSELFSLRAPPSLF